MDLTAAPAAIVREARPVDQPTLLDFNARLASETEGKTFDPGVLAQGLAAALADPDQLRYGVAEKASSDRIIGQAAIIREWSDWHNGWVRWFQIAYVHPDFRNRGVFRALQGRSAPLSSGPPT
jgi:GNAT superfamily N-acetyltransferase